MVQTIRGRIMKFRGPILNLLKKCLNCALQVGEVYKLAHLQIQATTAKFSRIIPGHIELKFLKDTTVKK